MVGFPVRLQMDTTPFQAPAAVTTTAAMELAGWWHVVLVWPGTPSLWSVTGGIKFTAELKYPFQLTINMIKYLIICQNTFDFVSSHSIIVKEKLVENYVGVPINQASGGES